MSRTRPKLLGALAAAVCTLAGCSLFVGDSVPESLDDWPTRSKIEIEDSAVITETHDDFPLLVAIDSSFDVQPDGRDLRFATSDAVLLDHELEVDPDTGTIYAWLRIPSLSPEREPLFVYYGNSSATDASAGPDVWDDDFAAVWHLSSEATGDVRDFVDSTAFAHPARGIAGDAGMPTREPGAIGSGQTFDQGSHINAGNPAALDLSGLQLTVEMWALYPTAPLDVPDTEDLGAVAKGGFFDGYRLLVSSRGRIKFQLTGENFTASSGEDAVSEGSWHYLVARYADGVMEVYADGVRTGAATRTGPIDSTNDPFIIGRGQPDRYAFVGTLDEVRVSSIARSDEWIDLQFSSMRETLVSIGPPESL